MKLFEENKPKQDAAMIISQLLNEFKEVSGSVATQMISPSGLACQVACALKLNGIPTEPQKESFQSRGFAENGEDRHKRIQSFLSKSPYWVDVADYVKKKKLNIEVVTNEMRVKKKRDNYIEEFSQLNGKASVEGLTKDEDERFKHLSEWLSIPDEVHIRKMHDDDPYETLLQHKELPVRFKCDGMLLIDGVYYVLEIKTERSQANVFRTTYDPKHQKQGITYTTLLHTDNILWLYEGRDYLEQKLFVQKVKVDEKQEMLKYLHEIVDNKDKIENLHQDPKSCNYCPYKKYCRNYFKEYKKKLKEEAKNETN